MIPQTVNITQCLIHNLKMTHKIYKTSTIVFLLALMLGSFYLLKSQIACGSNTALLKKIVSYAYAAPYSSSQSGTCQIGYETYDLIGSGYFTVPSQGNQEQSKRFSGFEVYEYFYPANPEKNNEDRNKLYSFNSNGSAEVSGNFVIQGEQTQLYNEHESGSMNISSYDEPGANGQDEKHRSNITFNPQSSDVTINRGASVSYTWDETDDDGVGPSVFVNNENSRLEIEPGYYMSGTKKDAVVETSLVGTEAGFLWQEHLATGEGPGKIQGARAMHYAEPYLYIADTGNRRIVRYDTRESVSNLDEKFRALGNRAWNWNVQGIAVEVDPEKEVDELYMYVTDSISNSVIRTTIDGKGWKHSYQNVDDYQSRLFLEGDEYFETGEVGEVTINGAPTKFTRSVTLRDCGYNAQVVQAVGTKEHDEWRASTTLAQGGYWHTLAERKYFELDYNTEVPVLSEDEDCVFGEKCFYFNGEEYFEIPSHAAWNFEDDYFSIDLWLNFSSIRKTAALVSRPDSFLLEWKPNNAHPASTTAEKQAMMAQSTLNFAFIGQGDESGGNTFQTITRRWLPQINTWYHLSVIRFEDDRMLIAIDGEVLGDRAENLHGKMRRGQNKLEIAGYQGDKIFHGKMDEIRIAKGNTEWGADFSRRYQLDNPRGIVWRPDDLSDDDPFGDLYVVDSGHGRIVKMRADFWKWSHFGDVGSGIYQFNQPSDIHYYGGNYYIADTGNRRIIQTNMSGMVENFKGVSSGSFNTVYNSPSPGLVGVYVDGSDIVVADSFNSQVIRNGTAIGGKNPWDNLFRFTSPVAIEKRTSTNNFLILDGVSEYDFSAQTVDRSIDLYDEPQRAGIVARFNGGGLTAETFNAEEVITRYGNDDWRQWGQGPGIAHCPEAANTAASFNGQNCDSWSGRGQNVNCDDLDNTCVGQWDWEVYWPECTRFTATIGVTRICREPLYCDPGNLQSPKPLNTQDPGDVVCACHNNNYANDCHTSCQPEVLSCHEGYAVSTSFYADGAPAWAPNDKPNVIAEGVSPSYNECAGVGPVMLSEDCSRTMNPVLFGDWPVLEAVSNAQVGLGASILNLGQLVQRLQDAGWPARLISPSSHYSQFYDMDFSPECGQVAKVQDYIIEVDDNREPVTGYMSHRLIRVFGEENEQGGLTWTAIAISLEDLLYDIDIANSMGGINECSWTLGHDYYHSQEDIILRELIGDLTLGLPPVPENIINLSNRLRERGYQAYPISQSPARIHDRYSGENFYANCGRRESVDDYFIVVRSGYMWKIFRVFGAPVADYHAWDISTFPDEWLQRDIDVAQRTLCSITLGGKPCNNENNCSALDDIIQIQAGLAPSISNVDTLITSLRSRGYEANRLSSAFRFDPTVSNGATFTDDCNSRSLVNDYFVEVDGALFRIFEGNGATMQWMAEMVYYIDILRDHLD